MAPSHYTRENTEIIAVLSHRQDTDVDKTHPCWPISRNITDIIYIAQFYNNNLPLPKHFKPRTQNLTLQLSPCKAPLTNHHNGHSAQNRCIPRRQYGCGPLSAQAHPCRRSPMHRPLPLPIQAHRYIPAREKPKPSGRAGQCARYRCRLQVPRGRGREARR